MPNELEKWKNYLTDMKTPLENPTPAVTNKLIVIGWTGVKRCYLNIPKEEAIRRFAEKESDPFDVIKDYLTKHDLVKEFVFDDEFGAYDAWK